jgi:hypothetical protein
MFVLAQPCLFAEGHSAAGSENQKAETHQKLSGNGFDYAEVLQRLSSFLMPNAQGTCRTVFALRGVATQPSMTAKMRVLISRADITMREIT